MNLFLDDLRKAPAGFTVTRSADECILLLNELSVDILCLDFHLGHGEKTGMAVVDFIIERNCWPKEIYLHSSDRNMRQLMYFRLSNQAPANVLIRMGPYHPRPTT